ncbi:hypothetical protein, partial [Chamaesiphon sp. VAR_48_metabat_135_sub]|uniref:hypothetical protein n=1 Tax=Chamaesiphon sp. VAR_48_metabat_135_sub TaxID=2964699 RepID=UPI00286B1A7A
NRDFGSTTERLEMRQFYLFDVYHSSRCIPKRHKSAFSQVNILPDSRSVCGFEGFDRVNDILGF